MVGGGAPARSRFDGIEVYGQPESPAPNSYTPTHRLQFLIPGLEGLPTTTFASRLCAVRHDRMVNRLYLFTD